MSHRSILYSKIVPSSETPKLLLFLMRNKVARTETQALLDAIRKETGDGRVALIVGQQEVDL